MANSKKNAKASSAPSTDARRDPKGYLKPAFLKEFEAAKGVIFIAADVIGIDPHTVSGWKKRDPDFLAEFTRLEINAKTRDNEKLVKSCVSSAIEGDPEYLIKDGQNVVQRNPDGSPLLDAAGNPLLVIVRRRYDGHLRTFLLERRMPQEFSNRIETTVPDSFVSKISSSFMSILRRLVPEVCPHCKSHLGLHPEIVKELETLGAKMNVT